MDRLGGSEGGAGLRLESGQTGWASGREWACDRDLGKLPSSFFSSYPGPADDVMDDCRPRIRVVGLRLGPIQCPQLLKGLNLREDSDDLLRAEDYYRTRTSW